MRDLLATVTQLRSEVEADRKLLDSPPNPKKTEHEGGGKPGDDFNRRATEAESRSRLVNHGYRGHRPGGDRQHFTRPGKKELEASGTLFLSGLTYYNFSNNAPHFKPNESYTPFAQFAILEHGGDYSKAAKDLRAQGYGDSPATSPKIVEMPEQKKKTPGTTEPECYLEQLTDTDADSNATYEWLIPKLVPKGEPMAIAGKGSAGKSTLALEFSARIMEADHAAGVVYICAEGTYRDTKIKARQMGLTCLNRFFFLKRKNGGTSFKLSEKEDLPLVAKALETAKAAGHKIVFVVIDSIRGMHRGSINDDIVGEVMQAVNAELCGRLGITVCYIHHAKKNTQDGAAMDLFLGSVTVVNALRYGLFMVKKTNRLREVEVAKSNLGHDDIFFNAELTADQRVSLTYAGIRGDEDDLVDPTQLDKAEEIVLSMLHGGESVPAYLIYQAGEQQGICDKTMKRVKKLRNIDSFQQNKRWYWRLLPFELKKLDIGDGGPSGPPEA